MWRCIQKYTPLFCLDVLGITCDYLQERNGMKNRLKYYIIISVIGLCVIGCSNIASKQEQGIDDSYTNTIDLNDGQVEDSAEKNDLSYDYNRVISQQSVCRALGVPEDAQVVVLYGNPFYQESVDVYLVYADIYGTNAYAGYYASGSFDIATGELFSTFMWDKISDGQNYNSDGSMFRVKVAASDGFVNLRLGPTTDYEIIMQIENNEILSVYNCDEEKAWYQIVYQGKSGWIAASQAKIVE